MVTFTVSRPWMLYYWKRAFGTYWTGGYVELSEGWGFEKNLLPLQGREPPIIKPVSPTELSQLSSSEVRHSWNYKQNKTKLRGLSPQANYTGRATVAYRQS
jgi:hypothetical protein